MTAINVEKGQPLAAVMGDDALKAFRKAFGKSYQHFDSAEAMLKSMNDIAGKTNNFGGVPVLAQSVEQNEAGEYVFAADAADYYADLQPTLAYSYRKGRGNDDSAITAVLAFGIPTVDSVVADAEDPDGTGLLAKLVSKECRHVYFRSVREADTPEALIAGMEAAPRDLSAFAASSRSSAEELDTECFDAVWPALRRHYKAEQPDLNNSLPPKQEVIKSIRSKSYAEGVWPELESRGIFLSVAADIVFAAMNAEGDELDPSEVKAWANARTTVDIPYKRIDTATLDKIATDKSRLDVLGLDAS